MGILDGYLVRVSCKTYNHANYITDALHGFVIQQTGFPYVCTIIDDASTDGTQEVIKNFINANFDLQDASIAYEKETSDCHTTFAQHKSNKNCYFAIIFLKENHYSKRRSKKPYITEWLDTKYIALCEGDDYWTDPMKLQKQVGYLEGHPDCCMCCHTADWEIDGRLYKGGCQHKESCNLTTEEVIRNGGLYLATNSLVYRRWLSVDVPAWRAKAVIGDFPLQILGTLRGGLHFLSDTMSVYRYLCRGSWTAQHFVSNSNGKEIRIAHAKNKVLWLGLLDKDTEYRYTKVIHSCLFPEYNFLYNSGEIGIGEYFQAVRRADEKHYKRVIKDFLIRNWKLPYKVWERYVMKR